MLLRKSAVAAAKDEKVCPDGKEKSPGGGISGKSDVLKLKGRILSTSGFSVMLHIISDRIRESDIHNPVCRVLLKQRRVADIKIHIKPPFPRVDINAIKPSSSGV